MTGRKVALFLLGLFLFFVSPAKVLADEGTSCRHRYLTLTNPVRGRNLWLDNTLKPLENQYKAVADRNFSATWLLQYDALTDKEIIAFIKDHFEVNQEIGLFLEISENLARSARVVYPPLVPWYEPQAVFLSGYSQSERRKLIDALFTQFKETFGHYPVSVGAWWIDSYSLAYIKNKYGLKAALIVADQQTTDNYGVWGQWWGVPYYPSLANVLLPAQNSQTKLDVVVLQWAQRDLTKAYGEGKSFSNYSLQANDYLERGLDTSYFKQLAGQYLDCRLPVGQITVGLETGIESVKVFPEYINQLAVLSETGGLQSVTMMEFSDRYRSLYPSNPEKIIIKDNQSEWFLTPRGRENRFLKEIIIYQDNLAFEDFFAADKKSFLNRKLPISPKNFLSSPLLILLAFIFGLVLYYQNGLAWYYWPVSFFILASFLTAFLTYAKFGRIVYFGPVVKNISVTQFFLAVIPYLLFMPVLKYLIRKIKNLKLLMLCLPLSFAADFLVGVLRYTRLHGAHYFGFAWDALRFIGLKVSPSSLAVVNQDFSSLIANSLLKFDFDFIWENNMISLIIYPLAHFVLGVFIYFVLNKLPKRPRRIAIIIIFVFFCFYIYNTITSNPRAVF